MKRWTKGLLGLHAARGEDGPAAIALKLYEVGGKYSQSAISLWLNAWRIPEGDARTLLRIVYNVPEEDWMVRVDPPREVAA